jgi:hypothetical protein
VDREKSHGSRFWLNANRATEDEKAVREFLRGKGRGIDGARFRAFVRDCRRRVGPNPVFEPDIDMVLNGVRYAWGVWFRPRPGTDEVVQQEVLQQHGGMALPDRPPVDTVTTRESDDDAATADDVALPGESVTSSPRLGGIQTVVASSGGRANTDGLTARSATSPGTKVETRAASAAKEPGSERRRRT